MRDRSQQTFLREGAFWSVACVALWSGALVGWLWLWRLPTISNDDLYFITRAGQSHGSTTWDAWWQHLATDIMQRNGRTGDAWVELFFALGAVPARIVMALLCWGMSRAWWQWIQAATSPVLEASSTRLLAQVGCLAAPWALCAWDARLTGDTLFFMSATVGYVGGAWLLAAGSWRFIALVSSSQRSSNAGWIWSALLLALAAWHHESLALMIMGLFLGLTVIERSRLRHWGVLPLTAMALSLIHSAARLAAPGMWARRELMASRVPAPHPSPLSQMGHSLASLPVTEAIGFWSLALATLLPLATSSSRQSGWWRDRWVLSGALLVVTAAWAGIGLRFAAHPTLPASIPSRTHVITLILSLVWMLVSSWSLLVCSNGGSRQLHLVTLWVVLGGYAIPWANGTPFGRPFTFPLIVTIVYLIQSVVTAAESPLPRLADDVRVLLASLLLAPVVGPAMPLAARAADGLQQNHQQWSCVEQQVERARRAPASTIAVPQSPAQREFAGDWIKPRAGNATRLRLFWGLPPETNVQWTKKVNPCR